MASWQMHAVALLLRTTRRRTWASADRARRKLEAPKREAPPPRGLTRRHDVSSRTVEGFPCWTVRPRTTVTAAAVYLHGGAYLAGISPQHWTLIGRLADAGVRVEVPLYGLAPQHTYREAYPFVHAVYRELAQEAPSGGLVLVGDSAGGGLALGLAQDLQTDGARHPDRLVLLSPWLDLTLGHPRIPEFERYDPWLAKPGLVEAGLAWAGDDDPTAPRLSPGNGPRKGLPPTWVFIGTREIAYPDAADFAEAASAAGVEVELVVADGAVHVYPLVPTPEGAEGTRAVVAAVAGRWAVSAAERGPSAGSAASA